MHSHITRNRENYHIDSTSYSALQKSLFSDKLRLFNALSCEIKETLTVE